MFGARPARRFLRGEVVADRTRLDSTDDYAGLLGNLAFSLSLYSGQMCTTPQNIFVPAGGIDPDSVTTPGIFVQRIFEGKAYEKRIEKRTVRKK